MADEKYIVFKLEEFFQLMGELALPPYYPHPEIVGSQGDPVGTDWECSNIAQHIEERARAVAIKDAVVIRRQDTFAPIPLGVYADCVNLTLSLADGKSPITEGLAETASYFSQQAALSWNSNRKLPD